MLGDEAVTNLIVELLPPGGRVLDVGCGGGHTLRALTRRGVEGMGIDPHPYGRTPCRRLRAEEIGRLGERFDLIYTLYALHEFDTPGRFPREAKEILRSGGVLLIVDWIQGARTGAQERYFAPQTVAGWMADAGFDVLRQEVRGETMIVAGRTPVPRTERGERDHRSLEEVWMRKIAVGGKGGSGKSSIVALLANAIRERGYRVLVVDSDESNPGLYRKLGLERRPTPLLELVGGKDQVFQTFSKDSESPPTILMREDIRVADIPPEYIVEMDGIGLVCIGKILQSLEGCACPMGALSREFLGRLSLQEDEMAIVDMEAGIEHFGRGVETSIDSMLIVAEASLDSLELAEKMHALAAEVEMENTWTILNKVRSEEIASRLRDELERRRVRVIGSIGYDPEIFQAGLEGRPIRASEAEEDVERVASQLL